MYKRNREKYVPKGREHEAICVVCGKSFISKAAGKYCSDECRKKAKLDRYKAYRKRFCKDFYEDDDLSTQEKTLSTNEKLLSTGRDIWSMVNAALEHHMSYGKYIEWLENGMNERRT